MAHPVFARLFACLSRFAEPSLARHRRELVRDLNGRVLELGAGTGASFRYYPAEVEELFALEPEPYLRARAEDAARSAPVRVNVVDGDAGRLPFADHEFDAAVVSLVLCSVPDQGRALAEIKRILRPGGELRFWEHVAAPRDSARRRVQRAADTVWPHLFGGCHTARDTVAAIEAAGFDLERVRPFDLQRGPTKPHVIGTARAGDAQPSAS